MDIKEFLKECQVKANLQAPEVVLRNGHIAQIPKVDPLEVLLLVHPHPMEFAARVVVNFVLIDGATINSGNVPKAACYIDGDELFNLFQLVIKRMKE